MRDLMVTFDGQVGTDRGALSREFFYLVFEACVSGTYKGVELMSGERGRLIPANDDSLIEAFRCLGMALAHAVRHGCRGLPGLSPAVKYYLVRGQGLAFIEDECPPISIDDVDDENLYHLLTKVLIDQTVFEKPRFFDFPKWRSSASLISIATRYCSFSRIRQMAPISRFCRDYCCAQHIHTDATCDIWPTSSNA